MEQMNCKNTDWSLVDELIPKKDYRPESKPNKKDYEEDEEGIYIQDMIIYFQEWTNNILEYNKIIAKFFKYGPEHTEWRNFYKIDLAAAADRKRKNENNIKSWNRKLWYYKRNRK